MTAAAIIRDSAAAGVTLSLSAAGTIKATGEQAAVVRWLSTIKENKPGIVALLAANDKPFEAARWLIHFEVLEAYPDALAAEPIEPGRRQPDARLPGDQEAAILAWLAQIGESDQTIIDDLLTLCMHDADARQYFLGRAGACAISGR